MTASPSCPPHIRAELRTCRHCGRPVDHPAIPVSRHRTSEGVVVYARCACGTMQVWLEIIEYRLSAGGIR